MTILNLISEWVTPKEEITNPFKYLLSEQYPKDLVVFVAILVLVFIGVYFSGVL